MSIEKMLCLSTGHITQEQSGQLEERVALKIENLGPGDWTEHFVVYPHDEYGFLLCVAGKDRLDLVDEVPDNILAIYDQAIAEQCDWVLLDRDAELYDDLPSFDW